MESNRNVADMERALSEFAGIDVGATVLTARGLTDINKHMSSPNMEMYGEPFVMFVAIILGFYRNDSRLFLNGLHGLSKSVRTSTLMLSVFEAVATSNARDAERNKHGYVYYAQADNGLIKIGTSIDPIRRLNSLRAQNSENDITLLAVSDGGEEEEKRMHVLFATERCHGEWFEPSTDLLKHINAVKAANKDTEERMRAAHGLRRGAS